jgi:hypothetical protein
MHYALQVTLILLCGFLSGCFEDTPVTREVLAIQAKPHAVATVKLVGGDHWYLKIGDKLTNEAARKMKVTLSVKLPPSENHTIVLMREHGESSILSKSEFQIAYDDVLENAWKDGEEDSHIRLEAPDSVKKIEIIFEVKISGVDLPLEVPVKVEAIYEPVSL